MDILSVIVSSYNSLRIKVCCKSEPETSANFEIQFMKCQLKWSPNSKEDIGYLLIKLNKCVDDDILYTSKVNCKELNITKKIIVDDDWHLLGFCTLASTSPYCSIITVIFNIEIIIDIKASSHLRLFSEDISTTDFEIKGTDGSIRVHKVVLATASEVFKKMITTDFKEKKDAQVDLPYPKCVLQVLKDYLYLNTLNDDNVETLFMLAHCYMMCELKRKCIMRLCSNTMTEKTIETTESLN